MDENILLNDDKFLTEVREYAIKEHNNRAIDPNSPENFNALCYSAGFVRALKARGYKITTNKDSQ